MKLKNFIQVLIIIVFISAFFKNANAAVEFMTSWSAQSYAPTWFQGKIFPTFGSRVDVSFELVDNGKITDLSKNAVRWYLNDAMMKNENSGLGIKNIFFIPKYGYDSAEIKISVPDYKGQALTKIFSIPVKSPEVSIEQSFYENPSRGSNIFTMRPFYFNINNLNNLSFKWLVNGEEANLSNNAVFNLQISSDTQSGVGINIEARAENPKNTIESANKLLYLRVK
ncbi:MAG: hypothetical protein QMD86_01595 [Patescibacteria group bacterium]|nr:hypothetical protein [Patescibacteria group bacterium]